jgi:hypothetical protein
MIDNHLYPACSDVWLEKESISEMIYKGKYTLSVVKWATCWGWNVDVVPVHEWDDPKEWHYLAKGRSKTRREGKADAIAAAVALEQGGTNRA